MSGFWNGWVVVLTTINIAACFWLIWWTQKPRKDEAAQGDHTGHYWDGDLCEYNNPLPRWWLWLFYITLFFSIGYLLLYPGMGRFAGVLGWSQHGAYQAELAEADVRYGPLFAKYAGTPVAGLAEDPSAVDIGRRLFLNYCATCHGSDAKGARGFPNLADNVWLYGGAPEAITTSIAQGRSGVMPAFGAVLGESGVKEVTAYVLSLSGRPVSEILRREGARHFALCVSCHGADGRGNQALGAPNLADNEWLYSGFPTTVQTSIRDGRHGVMPAHGELLGDDKVHLLAGYVYSLSNVRPAVSQ